MAPLTEILDMLRGQAFGAPYLPEGDLEGKTVVVTGANTGLGRECVVHLAQKRASHIILACRDVDKGTVAMQSVYASTACEKYTKLEVWALDLANYASVLAFGDRVRTSLPRLDAFVANAGMEIQEYRTAEDLEIHLTVNVVSTFLSALLSLPKLRATAQQYGGQASLVFAGSMYHIFGPDGEFNAGMSEDVDMFEVLSSSDPASTDIVWRYALSKLMAHHCFHGLVDAMQKGEWAGVAVSLVNPGWCGTELSRAKTAGLGEKVWFKLLGWTAEKGSKTYVHALMMGKEGHGRYLSGCTATRESEYVRSERGKRVQEKMWKDLMWRIARISPEAAKTV